MEHFSVCTNKKWRQLLWAHDEASRDWVRQFDAEHMLEPRQEGSRLWRFEAPLEFASTADPLMEVHLRRDGPRVEAWATLDGMESRLTNVPPPLPSHVIDAMNDLVRVATAEETLEIAMRWYLSWGHQGCTHPDEMCFWGDRTDTTAYVVDDVDGWLRTGTTLPVRADGGEVGLFFGLVGETSGLFLASKIAESIDGRYQWADGHAGWYGLDGPGRRGLLALDGRDAARGRE